MKSGIIVVCAAAICFASVNISVNDTANASEVSFTSVMTSFVTEGMMFFIICGKIIFTFVCIRV